MGVGELKNYGRPKLWLPTFIATCQNWKGRGGLWVVLRSEVWAVQEVRGWGLESIGEGVWEPGGASWWVAHPVTGATKETSRLEEASPPSTSCPQLSKKYGPVFTVHLGPRRRVVVLVGHQAVQEALGGQAEEFSGRGMLATLDRTFDGHGK